MSHKIMFQGTGSSVGKSILTAGLCRLFVRDGLKCAPFKSQNMALNSFVTMEGGEMGRAQVVQAEAAKVAPHVHMNPVLLKPTGDMGSQVIVQGKVMGNLSARDYYANKSFLMEKVMESFHALEGDYDVIVIEGAGSPAEINLRQNDIVNMGLAEIVSAPVILIGDIDKGGVFAQILGTYLLLSESERSRIKGYVINKFRGDVSLLTPGLEMFKEHCPLPCLGVVPYIPLAIDDEDSVTDRFMKDHPTKPQLVQIGIVRLPYLSNFTDFTVLEQEKDVELSYFDDPLLLEAFDLIILPGSKNTMKDMAFLNERGLTEAILQAAHRGQKILGICGGYQMLGTLMADPNQMESGETAMAGIGLLPMETVMSKEKHTIQAKGQIVGDLFGAKTSGTWVEGYEIHMGISRVAPSANVFMQVKASSGIGSSKKDGAVTLEGNVAGCYMHGLFDHRSFRGALLNHLRNEKGYESRMAYDYVAYKDQAYDALADHLKAHLDYDKIKEIAGVE